MYPFHVLTEQHCIPFLNPWNEVNEQYYRRTLSITKGNVVMYVNPKHAETREQSQTSSSLSFFNVVDRPIQHFTSGILSLCLFDSQTTVQPQQLSSKILENDSTKDEKTRKLKIS